MSGVTQVFCGNVPFDATRDEVKLAFSSYGEVVEVYSFDKKGFFFVAFASAAGAKAAVAASTRMDGRELRVEWPKNVNEVIDKTSLCIKSLPIGTTEQMLRSMFDGRIRHVQISWVDALKAEGAFIQFETEEAALRARESNATLHGTPLVMELRRISHGTRGGTRQRAPGQAPSGNREPATPTATRTSSVGSSVSGSVASSQPLTPAVSMASTPVNTPVKRSALNVHAPGFSGVVAPASLVTAPGARVQHRPSESMVTTNDDASTIMVTGAGTVNASASEVKEAFESKESNLILDVQPLANASWLVTFKDAASAADAARRDVWLYGVKLHCKSPSQLQPKSPTRRLISAPPPPGQISPGAPSFAMPNPNSGATARPPSPNSPTAAVQDGAWVLLKRGASPVYVLFNKDGVIDLTPFHSEHSSAP